MVFPSNVSGSCRDRIHAGKIGWIRPIRPAKAASDRTRNYTQECAGPSVRSRISCHSSGGKSAAMPYANSSPIPRPSGVLVNSFWQAGSFIVVRNNGIAEVSIRRKKNGRGKAACSFLHGLQNLESFGFFVSQPQCERSLGRRDCLVTTV